MTKETKKPQFNYSQITDAALRTRLKDAAEEIHAYHRRDAEEFLRIGLRLKEVHSWLKAALFQQWASAEFGWASYATAYNHMRVAKHFAGVPGVERIQRTALYELSRDTASEAARDRAKRLAADGINVSHETALDIIAETGRTKPLRNAKFADAPNVHRQHLTQLRASLFRIVRRWPADERSRLAEELVRLVREVILEAETSAERDETDTPESSPLNVVTMDDAALAAGVLSA